MCLISFWLIPKAAALSGHICMGRMVFPNGSNTARVHLLFTRWTGELACWHWDFFGGKKLETRLALPVSSNQLQVWLILTWGRWVSIFLIVLPSLDFYSKCPAHSRECSKWLTYRTFSVNACFFHTSYLLYARPQEMLSNIICQVYKTTLSNYLGFPHSVVGQEDLKLLETSVCSRDPRLSCWCHVTLRNEERDFFLA